MLSVDSARCGWDTSHYHLSKSCVFMVIDLLSRKSALREKSPKLFLCFTNREIQGGFITVVLTQIPLA